MNKINTLAIKTKHGVIYGRNALIATSTAFSDRPLEITINASLSLACCLPEVIGTAPVKVTFKFYDTTSIAVYRLDDYPYEKYLSSCFDEVTSDKSNGKKRYILSTYDSVFDIAGRCEVIFS